VVNPSKQDPSIDTHGCVQLSHASEGLAQAHPNYALEPSLM